MRTRNVAVVDYGMGNLHSIANALRAVGADVRLVSDADRLAAADHVVLPGVGAFGASMTNLRAAGLDEALHRHVAAGRPLLGICLGFQVLFERGTENCADSAGFAGLGFFAGTVSRFVTGLHVPHVGWNVLRPSRPHPLIEGVTDGDHVFFVHSFRPADPDPADVIATSDYDGAFCCAVARGTVAGTQFHPEKSGEVGLRLLSRFVDWRP